MILSTAAIEAAVEPDATFDVPSAGLVDPNKQKETGLPCGLFKCSLLRYFILVLSLRLLGDLYGSFGFHRGKFSDQSS